MSTAIADLTLPAWATARVSENTSLSVEIDVDTDGYVKAWLPLLGVSEDQVDQYWLEVAYQCAKMDVQKALEGTDFDPRTCGKSHQINMSSAPQWSMKRFEEGKGLLLASRGLEAREHFKRIRGSLPFAS